MSKFLTGEELENTVYDIIWEAEQSLLIVSPYIKLDEYFKNLFQKHLNNPKLRLTIVFGKNEKDVNRSLRNEDFDFFKQFPNVSIIYVQDLHGKYYGNEKKGIITSINLYDYSFKNNIEFGVFSEQSMLSKFSKSADIDAWNHCLDLAHDYEAVFVRRPIYKTKKAIINLGKEYIKSETLLDLTDNFYGKKANRKDSGKRLGDFPDELDSNVDVRPERVWEKEEQIKGVAKSSGRKWDEVVEALNKSPLEEMRKGYCIRTGEEIEFNPEKPMSVQAFKKWNQFQDVNYGEAYCHYSGEQSFGETCFARPILRKNWKKAMK
ncbi:phospholipase D family protein [Salinimicrobium sp. WS361]|uniref:phospholipase D family protein n=1 Tax=Salinimicrobium sp. WS361 TaxID=3425123 RepID=UPI003D700B97